jgi:hypothetical protein
MAKTDAATGGNRRTIALILGKTGMYASVNGGDPTPLPLPEENGTKPPLAVNSLLDALDHFALADTDTHVVIIGTRADGTAGWDEVDPRELQNYGPKTLQFEFLSEAQALQRGYPNAQEGDFLARSTYPTTFSKDPSFLQPREGEVNVCGYIIFATAPRPEDGALLGSVRWWVDQDGVPTLVDIVHGASNRGKLYTIFGGSIVTTPNMVVTEVERLVEAHPAVNVVFVWNQDGVTQYNAYKDPRGDFWYLVRPKGEFERVNGRVAVALSAQAIARQVSAGSATPTPVPPSTVDPTDADGDTAKKKDDA